jgi:hypothetical protein
MNYNPNRVHPPLREVQHELELGQKWHYLNVDCAHEKPECIAGMRDNKKFDDISIVNSVAELVVWDENYANKETQMDDRVTRGRLHARHLIKDFHNFLNI